MSNWRRGLKQSWKWKMALLETKLIFQGPILHGTMIMGGRVFEYFSPSHLDLDNHNRSARNRVR